MPIKKVVVSPKAPTDTALDYDSPPSPTFPLSVATYNPQQYAHAHDTADNPPSFSPNASRIWTRDVGAPTTANLFQQHPFFLHFFARGVEATYRARYSQVHYTYFRWLYALGIVFWLAFLVRALVMLPAPWALTQVYLRMACLVLSIPIGVVMMFMRTLFLRWFNLIICLMILLWGSTLMCISFLESVIQVQAIASVRVASLFALCSIASRTFLPAHLFYSVFLVAHIVFVVVFRLDFHTLFLVICIYILACVAAFVTERSHRRVFVLQKVAKADQDTVAGLLKLMLPVTVVTRLLAREVVADLYPNVTVLFAEICDYHQRFSLFSSTQIVDMVNEFYAHIDMIAGDVHQVESLGEQALFVTGCPVETSQHAARMAAFALRLSEEVGQHRCWPDGKPLVLRIGLHSGRVMASVIGKKRPQYNLIGDAVNTAARMMSSCEAGKIHVSPSAHALLRRDFSFTPCTPREYKGKGVLETYYLDAHLSEEKRTAEACLYEAASEGRQVNAAQQSLNYGRKRLAHTLSNGVARAKLQALATTKNLNSQTSSIAKVAALLSPTQENTVVHKPSRTRRKSLVEMYNAATAAQAQDAQRVGELFAAPDRMYTSLLRLRFRNNTFEREFAEASLAYMRSAHRQGIFTLSLFFAATFPVKRIINEFSPLLVLWRGVNVLLCFLLLLACSRDEWARFGSAAVTVFGLWSVCYIIIEPLLAHMSPMDIADIVMSEIFLLFILFRTNGLGFVLSSATAAVYLLCLIVCLWVVAGSLAISHLESLSYVPVMLVFFLLSKFISERLARQAWVLHRRSECEKELLGNMVSNILPSHVTNLMLSGKAVPVQSFECVALLFSDIVGFTALSAALSPQEVRRILHYMYTMFDDLVEEYGLYKVVTVGDAYIIAAGCPSPCSHPVQKLVNVAFGMHEVLKLEDAKIQRHNLKLRIGIHIGPVFAGLVGTRAPHYHVFGPTAHVAHVLEGHAPPGKTLLSEAALTFLSRQAVLVDPPSAVKVDGADVTTFVIEPLPGPESP